MTEIEVKKYLHHKKGEEPGLPLFVYEGLLNQKNGTVTAGTADPLFENEADVYLNRSDYVTFDAADDGWTFQKAGTYIVDMIVNLQTLNGAEAGITNSGSATFLQNWVFADGLTGMNDAYLRPVRVLLSATAGETFIPNISSGTANSSISVDAVLVTIRKVK